jgi:hypothetical protein
VFPISSNQKIVRSHKFKGSGPNILATLKMNEEGEVNQIIPQKKEFEKEIEIKEVPKVLETPVKLKKINSNENIKQEPIPVDVLEEEEEEEEEEEDWEEWNDESNKIKNPISAPKVVKEQIPTKKIKKIGAEEDDDPEETKVVEEPNYFSQFEKEEPKKKEETKQIEPKKESKKEKAKQMEEEILNDEDIGSEWGSELLEDNQLVETAEVNSIKG